MQGPSQMRTAQSLAPQMTDQARGEALALFAGHVLTHAVQNRRTDSEIRHQGNRGWIRDEPPVHFFC